MGSHELPRMDSAHVDEIGNIQFYTADGEGVITESGSTLLRSRHLGVVGSDALATVFELPEDSYVEPAERPRPMTPAEEYAIWNLGRKYDNWTRGAGHVSKIRK